MKKLLLPVILLLLGTGSGVGAGIFLKPSAEETAATDQTAENCVAPHADEIAVPAPHSPDETAPEPEYAKLNNQFVVPIVKDEAVEALVAMSISIQVPADGSDTIFAAEPKLRDSFLQVLFEHANIGSFSGNFTAANTMRILRQDLLHAAKAIVGEAAQDILILDIARQDS